MNRFSLLSLLLVLWTGSAVAQPVDDPIVVIEVWTELDPIVADGSERPVPRDVALERLVDEAQRVLSGMIYGYRFVYTPADPARRIAEHFDLEPIGTIARGDPGFTVFQTWIDRDRLYARIFYSMNASQMRWRQGWQASANIRSSAIGMTPFIGGPTEKHRAIPDGIRLAIREHVRQRNFNRPQAVTGAVILADAPAHGIRSGHYEARVSVYFQIDAIERYQHY
ncbi:MAG: hypothetical protein EA382_19015 [Spirochaetaceae bacterium]|nr:MAG: hypothetical protein EA382_19015 [Spirochaetaceae bacterium]